MPVDALAVLVRCKVAWPPRVRVGAYRQASSAVAVPLAVPVQRITAHWQSASGAVALAVQRHKLKLNFKLNFKPE